MATHRDIQGSNQDKSSSVPADSLKGQEMKKSAFAFATLVQRSIIAFVIVGVLGLAAFFVGKGQLTGWGSGEAQRFDSLKCYKVKDRARAFHATVNLSTMENPNSNSIAIDPGCKITGKVVRYCTPVSSAIVATDAVHTTVLGQELRDDFTCYKIKCATQAHSEPNLTDQFGRQIFRRYQTREVCVAAH
jgi:hypothetical protein